MTPSDIRSFRDSLGMTQAEAGQLLGVDGRTWRRWEAGDRPMLGAADRLLRAMQAHPHIIETLQAMTGTEETAT